MFTDSRLFRLIIDETEKTLSLIDLEICKSYSNLVENETIRENIFGMIISEYNLTKDIILKITGEEKFLICHNSKPSHDASNYTYKANLPCCKV